MKTQKKFFVRVGCLLLLALLMWTGAVSGEPTYTISGQVLFERGTPAVGVVVSDGAGHTAITNIDGEYTFANLSPGTYTLTPSKAGCTFTPISRTVTIATSNLTAINFTAILHSYPSYAWHTFYGSANYDYGYAIALDGEDNIYITGKSGGDWGTPRHAGGDILVMKLDRNGVYQWHAFYGLSGEGNVGSGIALDGNGNIYVAGTSTGSWGSPLHPFTQGVYPNQTDAFVLKLDPNGDYLWHTFYGANGYDYGNDLVVGSGGQIFVTGMSDTSWGTPLHAYTSSYDLFVLKLETGGVYQWHTFYGSATNDHGNAITLDPGGNVYVTGLGGANWGSPVFSTGNSDDIVVLKLDGNGAYQWHTFQGGVNRETGFDLALDGNGNVYVCGQATSNWGSPLNPYGESMQDAVGLKLNPNGVYQWHTFYGYGWSAGTELAVDQNANVYIVGNTNSNWGYGIHEFNGDYDIFVLRLDTYGMPLWHTFYGGYGANNGADYGRAMALGKNNAIYVTGNASSSQSEDDEWRAALHAHSGGADVVVLKLGGDTTTGLVSSLNPALFDQQFYFKATVKPVVGDGVPTGTVQFLKNGSDWGAPVALVNGVATGPVISSSFFDIYLVTAVYNGDTYFSTSVSYKLKQVVTDKLYPAYLPLARK